MPFVSLDPCPPLIVESFRPTAPQRRLAEAAAGLAVHYTVQELCAAAHVSPASYYRWQQQPGFAAWWMAETWNCLRGSAPLLLLSTMQFAIDGDAAARKLLFQYLVPPPSAPSQPSGPATAPAGSPPPVPAAAAPARLAHPSAAARPPAARPWPPAAEMTPVAGLPLGARAVKPPLRPGMAPAPGAAQPGLLRLRVGGAGPRPSGNLAAVRPWPYGHA